MTTNEMIEQAQKIEEIKNTIRSQNPEVQFPRIVKEPCFSRSIDGTFHRVANRFNVKNGDTGLSYSIPTGDYKVFSHEEAFFMAEQAVKDLPEYGKPEYKVQFIGEGAKMVLGVTFPEVKMEVKVGDFVAPELRMYNSYDLQWVFRSEFGARQLVCTNGMVAFKIQNQQTRKHLVSVLNVERLTDEIGERLENFSEQIGLWSSWAERKLSQLDYGVIAEDLPFSGPEKKKMVEEMNIIGMNTTVKSLIESNQLTAWDLHSAATQFATHEVRSEIRKIDLEGDIERVFMRHMQ